MARVGGFVVGDGTKVGDAGLTTAQQHTWDILAGYSPYYPAQAPQLRGRCFEIFSFDPVTWLPTTKLPHVVTGASRTAQLTGVGFQQDTLTFTIAGPTSAAVAAGAWLCIKQTLWNPTTVITQLGGVFRCVGAPSPTRLAGNDAATQAVKAVDWAQVALAIQQGSGWIDTTTWETDRLSYVAASKPLFPSTNPFGTDATVTWGTVLAAILSYGFGWAAYVDIGAPWATWGPSLLTGQGNPFLQIADPSKPISGYDQLTYLWPLVGGFTLGYVSETGHLILNPGGNRAADSGYFLTVDNTVGGSTPLPWTTPLVRTLGNPAATKVQYFYQGPGGNTPAGASASAATLGDDTAFRGQAVSNHPKFPYDQTLNSTLKIVETGAVKQALGFSDFTDFCQWKLRTLLAAADTVTIPVDCAVPPPPLGTTMRIHAPPDVDGQYRLEGFTQPQGAGLASWKCSWWSS